MSRAAGTGRLLARKPQPGVPRGHSRAFSDMWAHTNRSGILSYLKPLINTLKSPER